jgi:O-antigen/teichoic acid export membrane protein
LGVLVCGLITGGLAVTAGELVVFFFGSEFSETIPIARLLLLAIFFMTARRILTDGANGLGHPELGTVAEIASWVLLVPTLSLLVSPLGAEGVAISLAIAWGGSLAVLVALMLALTHRASAEVRSEGVP